MTENRDRLNLAFDEGERMTEWPGMVRFVQKELPPLHLPSGRVVACDPLMCLHLSPLDLVVSPGRYPVILTIADMGTDQRVAFARLQLAPERPNSWRLLTFPGQDLATLKEDEYFGYPVDSGTGCFADAVAAEALRDRMKREEDYFEDIVAEMQKTYVDTWSWAIVTPAPNTELEVACFNSGYGDGVYPSFVGEDNAGNPVCVLTDFQVIGLAGEST